VWGGGGGGGGVREDRERREGRVQKSGVGDGAAGVEGGGAASEGVAVDQEGSVPAGGPGRPRGHGKRWRGGKGGRQWRSSHVGAVRGRARGWRGMGEGEAGEGSRARKAPLRLRDIWSIRVKASEFRSEKTEIQLFSIWPSTARLRGLLIMTKLQGPATLAQR